MSTNEPKGLVYTWAPKYLRRDYFKAQVYTIWAHGPLGEVTKTKHPTRSRSDGMGWLAELSLQLPTGFVQLFLVFVVVG